jgi:hypothetical protein
MSDKLKKLQIKKLIQEYSFLQADFEYKNQLIEDYREEFIKEVYKTLDEENKSSTTETLKNVQIDTQKNSNKIELKEKSNVNQEIRRLYRLITKKTHPDYDKDGLYIEEYRKAVDAYQNGDNLVIYTLAHNFGFDYEIGDEALECLNQNLINLKNKIGRVELTYIYLWSQIKDGKLKENLILNFIKTNIK